MSEGEANKDATEDDDLEIRVQYPPWFYALIKELYSPQRLADIAKQSNDDSAMKGEGPKE